LREFFIVERFSRTRITITHIPSIFRKSDFSIFFGVRSLEHGFIKIAEFVLYKNRKIDTIRDFYCAVVSDFSLSFGWENIN
jgi:hypothetical protein